MVQIKKLACFDCQVAFPLNNDVIQTTNEYRLYNNMFPTEEQVLPPKNNKATNGNVE